MLHMTVGEMLARMSSEELTEWMVYLKIKHDEQEKAQREAEAKSRMRGRR